MSEFDQINAIYLGGFLLLVMLALIPRLKSTGLAKSVQMGLIWVLIFGGMILLVGEWPRIQSALDPAAARVEGDELRVRARQDGHFYIRGAINGVATTFLVDTGASDVVLTQETAEASGYPPEALSFDGRAQTANGIVPIAGTSVDSLEVGSIRVYDQRVAVNGGPLNENLLGMRFLNQLSSWRVENGELILVP
ncbi:MAG: TIGR02281 family clan AA aspartic protease [Pacificimonas sp.]